MESISERIRNAISVVDNGVGPGSNLSLSLDRLARVIEVGRQLDGVVALEDPHEMPELVQCLDAALVLGRGDGEFPVLATRLIDELTVRQAEVYDSIQRRNHALGDHESEAWRSLREEVQRLDIAAARTTAEELEAEARTRMTQLQAMFLDATRLRDDAQKMVDAVVTSKRDIELLATFKGTDALAEHFTKYEEDHQKASLGYRWATIGTLILVVAAAGLTFGLTFNPDLSGDTHDTFARISLVLALGALAAYLGRQSGQHRRQSEWAAAIVVQLKSFRTFTAMLDDAQRSDVHAMFARRVLGSPPPPGQASAPTADGSILPSTVIEAIARIR